jgi:hypothetical protein
MIVRSCVRAGQAGGRGRVRTCDRSGVNRDVGTYQRLYLHLQCPPEHPQTLESDIVSVETHSGDRYLEKESSVLEYLMLFDPVSPAAMDPLDSQTLLAKIMSNLAPRGTSAVPAAPARR